MTFDEIAVRAFTFACLFWGVVLVIGLAVEWRECWRDEPRFSHRINYIMAWVTALVLLVFGGLCTYALIIAGR